MKLYILLLLMLFSFNKEMKAQQALLRSPGVSTNYLDYNGNLAFGAGNLGIGIYPATSRLHIHSGNGFLTQPLFKSEVWSAIGGELASIQQLVRVGYLNYGIYQTHQPGVVLLNYSSFGVKL
jgi:hypothetical protein